MTRPYCPRCHNTGQVVVECEIPETGLWRRETRPCACVRPVWPWLLVAVLAVLIGVMPAIVAGLR